MMLRRIFVLGCVCVLGVSAFAAPPGKGKTTYALSLNITSASISENGGTTQATVSHNNPTGSDVVVTLSSSKSTEAAVPASVTIFKDSSSTTFTINSVDDTVMDGDQLVTISASASSYTNGSASLTVVDDDGPNFNYLLTYIDPPYLTKGIFIPHVNVRGQIVSSFYINAAAGDRQSHGFWANQGVSEDLNDWVAREITEKGGEGVPTGLVIATATGINDRGAIVGALSPIGNPDVRSGYVLDTAANPPCFHVLPDESLGTYTYPLRINDNGDVAGRIRDADGLWSLYLFNCGIYSLGDANIADTILPMIPAGSTGDVQINNGVLSNTQIAGDYRYIDATGSVINTSFVYTKGEPSSLTFLDIVADKPIDTVVDINDWGIMLGHHTQETLLKGNKARYDHSNYYLTATSAVLLPETSSAPVALNNSGDVLVGDRRVYRDEWRTSINLSDLIIGDPDSLLAWSMAEQDPSSMDNHVWDMTNRVDVDGDLIPDAGIITGYTGPRGFIDGVPRHFILTPVPKP